MTIKYLNLSKLSPNYSRSLFFGHGVFLYCTLSLFSSMVSYPRRPKVVGVNRGRRGCCLGPMCTLLRDDCDADCAESRCAESRCAESRPALHLLSTRSSAVAERPRDASCLSVVTFNTYSAIFYYWLIRGQIYHCIQ